MLQPSCGALTKKKKRTAQGSRQKEKKEEKDKRRRKANKLDLLHMKFQIWI